MPIPRVRSEKVYEGSQSVDRLKVRLDAELADAREGVLAMLALGESVPAQGGTVLRIRYNDALKQERYIISSGKGGVSIETGGVPGAVYAAASVSQMLAEHGGVLPHCLIEDEPRFVWRGLSLDICRHFFPMETVLRLVDLMAYYKYNRLHLHLSDDQGFRFESDRFPLLNSVGSRRASTLVRHGGRAYQDGQPHGGYYKKEELRSLVRFAKARGIEIVPELDMPGHALSVMAAYPGLACFAEPVEVATRFGVTDFSKKLYCAGSEETYDFLFALLDELMDVFEFPFIHIGGDEAVKTDWKRCERCQAVRREQGLKDERELQGYFLNRVIGHIESRGRRAIVWNDGLCDTLHKSAIAQYWTPLTHGGAKQTARYVNAGGEAILSPVTRVYYDYPYAATPLKQTYRFHPALRGVRKENEANILGVEAAIWTEWIDTPEKLFFNTLPRLAATAETGWSAREGACYADFLKRLKPHYALYERLGLTYARDRETPPPPWRRVRGVATFLKSETHAELLEQLKRERSQRNTKPQEAQEK